MSFNDEGPTGRNFLRHIEAIADSALPIKKLVENHSKESAEDMLLKTTAFCEEIVKVI